MHGSIQDACMHEEFTVTIMFYILLYNKCIHKYKIFLKNMRSIFLILFCIEKLHKPYMLHCLAGRKGAIKNVFRLI